MGRVARDPQETSGLPYGDAHEVYKGDREPRRIAPLEFPSVAAFEAFYNGPTY
jgi:uncharacterized protein (DUF1330 family)